jgi:hypothetical protein
MTDHGSEPYSHDGSRRDGIDRLAEADKQLRIVMQESEDDWTSEALHALRADLARVRGDGFQRASELHDGIRAHREGQR